MKDKVCPLLMITWDGKPTASGCMKRYCTFYDEHAQQCSQVSQAIALRDIAEQLKRNADAMLDYSPAKEPVEVELQPVKILPRSACDEYIVSTCGDCVYYEQKEVSTKCFLCSGGFPYKPLFKKKP